MLIENMSMQINVFEHKPVLLYKRDETCHDIKDDKVFQKFQTVAPRLFPSKRNKNLPCFKIQIVDNSVLIEAGYYIGFDWLIKGEKFVQVIPKVNPSAFSEFEEALDCPDITVESFSNKVEIDSADTRSKELDYLHMFMDAMSHPVVSKHVDDLIFIDWNDQQIEITQKDDMLTPFLIVQFLNLVKQLVKKGLRKSYYKIEDNLNNRVRGKILVNHHLNKNIVKNRFGKIYCEYSEFGIDSPENRLLKKVLNLVDKYIAAYPLFFRGFKNDITSNINYCKAAFQNVTEPDKNEDLTYIKCNPFYREYKESIKIGRYILKRLAYNLSNFCETKIKIPPFWINTPKLFELYTYHHLLVPFRKEEITYHYRTNGNELDFLINSSTHKMVVDAKYKLKYRKSHIHADIRQLAGYSRLECVYRDLGVCDLNAIIDCLIVYPSSDERTDHYKFNVALIGKNSVKAYRNFYKIGIPMPYL